MSKVIEIRPHIVLDRCQGIRLSVYNDDTPYTDKQCKHNATFIIDGVHYCRKHAGAKALEILMDGKCST